MIARLVTRDSQPVDEPLVRPPFEAPIEIDGPYRRRREPLDHVLRLIFAVLVWLGFFIALGYAVVKR